MLFSRIITAFCPQCVCKLYVVLTNGSICLREMHVADVSINYTFCRAVLAPCDVRPTPLLLHAMREFAAVNN